jgi:hypothetical protein
MSSPLLENLLIPNISIERYEFTGKFDGKNFNRPEMMEILDELEGKETI